MDILATRAEANCRNVSAVRPAVLESEGEAVAETRRGEFRLSAGAANAFESF